MHRGFTVVGCKWDGVLYLRHKLVICAYDSGSSKSKSRKCECNKPRRIPCAWIWKSAAGRACRWARTAGGAGAGFPCPRRGWTWGPCRAPGAALRPLRPHRPLRRLPHPRVPPPLHLLLGSPPSCFCCRGGGRSRSENEELRYSAKRQPSPDSHRHRPREAGCVKLQRDASEPSFPSSPYWYRQRGLSRRYNHQGLPEHRLPIDWSLTLQSGGGVFCFAADASTTTWSL